MPDQLADVQSKLGALKASFDKQDYAAVVTGAPAVLSAAQGLATAAAAKKDEVLKALNDTWTRLADSVPGEITGNPKPHRSSRQEVQQKAGCRNRSGRRRSPP